MLYYFFDIKSGPCVPPTASLRERWQNDTPCHGTQRRTIIGKVNEGWIRRGVVYQEQLRKEKERWTERVPSQVLYRVDHALRGEKARQEQWESLMHRLDPLLVDWELTEDQLQFVKDLIEEQFNLGRHPDTITEDELITMQAFAVDLVYS